MFNTDILKAEIEKYKEDLRQNGWKDDSKKLQAVEIFKNNWDEKLEIEDRLKHSIMSGFRLLSGRGYDNRDRILKLAAKDPEEVYNMFEMLYDDTRDVVDRIEEFKERADAVRRNNGLKFSGVTQNENTISTYLWLRFPDKYFIYQIGVLKNLSAKLESSYKFPNQNDNVNNLRNFLAFYEEIHKEIINDVELCALYKKAIEGETSYYQDPQFITLTLDLIYGIGHTTSKKKNGEQEGTSDEDDEKEILTDNTESITDTEHDESLRSDAELSDKAPYDERMFLNEVFMSETELHRLLRTLDYKKNIILQGPPGVGKTFAAKRLAYVKMGEANDERIRTVQFHQDFSYEDFVMGYKPKKEGGFELKYGSFYKFCKKAEKDSDNEYFFIIDEINRGNISKIFGELLMLIENEYRGEAGRALGVSLAYDEAGETFSVPENLYIIGMMNTADRSLALIDYALRRRFSFFDMKPAFGTEEDKKDGGFWEYVKGCDGNLLGRLIETTQRLNRDIGESLGNGFMIGHSYFCGLEGLTEDVIIERLVNVVYCDILPTIREYWFDEDKKVEHWESEFSRVLEEYGQK